MTPQQLGISPSYGHRRRVPGLRREELADLIGVSVNYYARLEQGEDHQISDSVLDAIARVLRLSPDERTHLFRLARPTPPVRGAGAEDRVRDSIHHLVAASPGAVVLVGRRTDILAGNPLGLALWCLSPEEIAAIGEADKPNQARRVFLDAAAKELYVDWEQQAQHLASYLRLASAERPEDLALHQLIGELSEQSADFARIWHEHPVQDCLHTRRRYLHPAVGRLVLDEEVLRLPDDPGQRLIMSAAPPNTPDADRLALLGSLTAG